MQHFLFFLDCRFLSLIFYFLKFILWMWTSPFILHAKNVIAGLLKQSPLELRASLDMVFGLRFCDLQVS